MPRWRSGSEFGDGPRVPLCREKRAQFMAKLKLARRPGRLTFSAVEIGRVLVNMLGADGRLDPTVDLLARRASANPSTVVRALAQLKELGFVTWTRRLVRDAASGWQCRQTSNAYQLAIPSACDTHLAKQTVSRVYKKEAVRQRADMTDEEARANVIRQLEQLGFPEKARMLA